MSVKPLSYRGFSLDFLVAGSNREKEGKRPGDISACFPPSPPPPPLPPHRVCCNRFHRSSRELPAFQQAPWQSYQIQVFTWHKTPQWCHQRCSYIPLPPLSHPHPASRPLPSLPLPQPVVWCPGEPLVPPSRLPATTKTRAAPRRSTSRSRCGPSAGSPRPALTCIPTGFASAWRSVARSVLAASSSALCGSWRKK